MCKLRPPEAGVSPEKGAGIELWSSTRAVFTHDYGVNSIALGLCSNSPGHIAATNHTRNPETGSTMRLLIPNGVKGPHERELRSCYQKEAGSKAATAYHGYLPCKALYVYQWFQNFQSLFNRKIHQKL